MKRKKVLLIYPPVTVYGSSWVGANVPLGLLYIFSYLKKNGIDVEFMDALGSDSLRKEKNGKGTRYGMSLKKVFNEIKRIKPDFVGIATMFTAYFDDSVEIAKIVKKIDKNITVFVGGSHVSADLLNVAKNKWIDIAVFGEGEETVCDLVSGKKLNQIKGIVYKKNGKLIKNKARDLIKNLDDIPFPAWEELDVEKYTAGSPFNLRAPIFPIISSRGCPGHCLYCSVNAVWQHKWRGRSAKNLIDEMEFLIKRYGAREFSFQDDSMSVDKIRLTEICNEILKRKLNIKWTTPNGIAHWTLTKSLLKKMKKAGCYRITFGIESGDEELRRWVGKPYSLKQAKDLTNYANKLGYWTLATNIIGFPYETQENINNTFNFAVESDVDLAFFFRLGPRPGTPIWEIFKKEGWLMKDRNILFSEDVACQTKYFSGSEIILMQRKMLRQFLIKRYLTPLVFIRIIRKIKSWEDFMYIVRLSLLGIKMGFVLVFKKEVSEARILKV